VRIQIIDLQRMRVPAFIVKRKHKNTLRTNTDQREHPRRNLRFRPSMKGSGSKLGYEIRREATLEIRIFNENPHKYGFLSRIYGLSISVFL
jgi:hypothetical protein